MAFFQDRDVTINMALFKRYQFYQLFDPNGPSVFGYNVRRLLSVASIAIVLAINVFSVMSFFVNADENAVDTIDSLLIMFIYCINAISFLKIVVFLRKADVVWDLFDFTRLNFLTSTNCRRNVTILHKYRDKGIKLTDFFLNYTSLVFVLWCAAPLVSNALNTTTDDDPNRRYQNIFNVMYPVTVAVYNRYFYVFYLMEMAMGTFILYNSIVIDLFLISICSSTTGQYEVLVTAFAGIGHRVDGSTSHGNDGLETRYFTSSVLFSEYEDNSFNAYKDFRMAVYDQVLVYKKLESLYSMIWIIVVSIIIINSIALVILSYSSIMIFTSAESFAIYRLIKLPTGYFCFVIQIFIYCYLFDTLNDKKESATFGMYSCNWTKMDLKFQKLLLLAMRMNNANKLMIKTSPTKIVNIQLFAHVMSTTYNIVSVMLNTVSKNKVEAES